MLAFSSSQFSGVAIYILSLDRDFFAISYLGKAISWAHQLDSVIVHHKERYCYMNSTVEYSCKMYTVK